ncbi:hypothetical protein G3N59_00705 [Paraburkholderia sp. Ac-20340]|uniref:hypothetical protein n=1 Tax=Paraburkholderia sp. Ac-20340 TaxID=2703888 RepID=UPI0019815B9E|nr:hypothetical protein [Paraburkholderia sp. Ac-20340]MBN3851885.1 hypothetical protein [Paraburkholderia sp. Ac-20340]
MKRFCFALAAILTMAGAHANPLDHGDFVSIPTRAGVTQSLFFATPAQKPAWVIVLFGGTPGALHLGPNGATTLKGNFLIRSAQHWIDDGEAVVLVDTPSDHTEGVDDDFRYGKDSVVDTQAIAAKVRERFPEAKMAFVGTSAGTVSVGNAMKRDAKIADAFVLTSPVTVSRKGDATIADLDTDGTQNRVLVVANAGDQCPSSPPDVAKRLAQNRHYAYVEVNSNEGDSNGAGRCGGHSPHGFLGIEMDVLKAIQGWLKGQGSGN